MLIRVTRAGRLVQKESTAHDAGRGCSGFTGISLLERRRGLGGGRRGWLAPSRFKERKEAARENQHDDEGEAEQEDESTQENAARDENPPENQIRDFGRRFQSGATRPPAVVSVGAQPHLLVP